MFFIQATVKLCKKKTMPRGDPYKLLLNSGGWGERPPPQVRHWSALIRLIFFLRRSGLANCLLAVKTKKISDFGPIVLLLPLKIE
jgi:hypothetical protein